MKGPTQAKQEAESKQSPELSNILEYYRQRVDELQKEREDWFERLERLRISQEDYHKQEWDLRRKNEEIYGMQKLMSEGQVSLFEEREQVLDLKRQMADFRSAATEDRNRILQLLTLGAKEEENQFYFKDSQPGTLLSVHTLLT